MTTTPHPHATNCTVCGLSLPGALPGAVCADRTQAGLAPLWCAPEAQAEAVDLSKRLGDTDPQTESPCPTCRTRDDCYRVRCPFRNGWEGLQRNGEPIMASRPAREDEQLGLGLD